jgi:hypothetical protein
MPRRWPRTHSGGSSRRSTRSGASRPSATGCTGSPPTRPTRSSAAVITSGTRSRGRRACRVSTISAGMPGLSRTGRRTSRTRRCRANCARSSHGRSSRFPRSFEPSSSCATWRDVERRGGGGPGDDGAGRQGPASPGAAVSAGASVALLGDPHLHRGSTGTSPRCRQSAGALRGNGDEWTKEEPRHGRSSGMRRVELRLDKEAGNPISWPRRWGRHKTLGAGPDSAGYRGYAGRGRVEMSGASPRTSRER